MPDATNNSERPAEPASPPPDRSDWPTRLIPLSEEGNDDDVLALTPAERIEMMWPLVVRAWAFTGEDVRGTRLQRHVVRVVRGGG